MVLHLQEIISPCLFGCAKRCSNLIITLYSYVDCLNLSTLFCCQYINYVSKPREASLGSHVDQQQYSPHKWSIISYLLTIIPFHCQLSFYGKSTHGSYTVGSIAKDENEREREKKMKQYSSYSITSSAIHRNPWA